jgi:hypothetical protein
VPERTAAAAAVTPRFGPRERSQSPVSRLLLHHPNSTTARPTLTPQPPGPILPHPIRAKPRGRLSLAAAGAVCSSSSGAAESGVCGGAAGVAAAAAPGGLYACAAVGVAGGG